MKGLFIKGQFVKWAKGSTKNCKETSTLRRN